MATSGQWVSTGEAARQLGYSVSWVRKQILDRRLPARVNIGMERRSYRIRLADLRAFEERYIRDDGLSPLPR